MAIDFDGTDDSLKTTTNVLRHSTFSATNYSFTVSCWVKPDAAQNASIWAQQQDDGQTQGRLVLEIISNNRKFKIRFQNSSATSGNYAYGTDYTVWYHLVATFGYAAAVGRHLYLNGNSTPIAFKDDSTGDSDRSSDHGADDLDFLIGAGLKTSNPWDETAHFNGQIAELAAWKTILTAGDISSLYAGASPLFVKSDQLLSYYPLGGPLVTSSTGTTDAFKDVIGGNNLTATSAPAFVETPPFSSSSTMFYPSAGVLQNNLSVAGGSSSSSSSSTKYVEQDLTGNDVMHEMIQENLRHQGRITVNSGGVNFTSTGKQNFIVGQGHINKMNDRLVEKNRTNQTDETHGGGPNTGT